MQRAILIFIGALFSGQAALAPFLRADEPAALTRYTFEEPHMGTMFRIVFYARDEASAKKAAKAAFARVAELNKILSDYLADSELMQLCKRAGAEPVKVSEDLFTVLKQAEQISRLSDGALDVSVGPVVRLWRVARKSNTLPDPEALKQALARVDYRKVRLDAERRTVQLLVMGMLLDLGSIAKGYTADQVLEVLRRHGITRALVAAGGDVTAADPPPDAKAWKVGIAPLTSDDKKTIQYLALARAAVSTAGDANQFLEIAGARYSHIVDPKTGMGLLGRCSVTVIAPSGMLADGLDTAACVLGSEKGMKLIVSQPNCAALFMQEQDGRIVTMQTPGFAQYIWK